MLPTVHFPCAAGHGVSLSELFPCSWSLGSRPHGLPVKTEADESLSILRHEAELVCGNPGTGRGDCLQSVSEEAVESDSEGQSFLLVFRG